MLNKLIPYIDQQIDELKHFNELLGLCEKIREGQENEAKEYPARYVGKDNYDHIELEKGIAYHRMTGERSVSLTDKNTSGCSKAIEIIYPMTLIGCIKKEFECDQYRDDSLANSVAFKIQEIQFPKNIRSEIKAFSVDVVLRGISTDRNAIWNDEYSQVPMSVDFARVYMAIRYEIRIEADSKCLNIINC